jgi:hypothetical protein
VKSGTGTAHPSSSYVPVSQSAYQSWHTVSFCIEKTTKKTLKKRGREAGSKSPCIEKSLKKCAGGKLCST